MSKITEIIKIPTTIIKKENLYNETPYKNPDQDTIPDRDNPHQDRDNLLPDRGNPLPDKNLNPEEEAEKYPRGGKRNSKSKSKKVVKKPVVSQKKQSIYKEILGKQMKIYKMPDSRKEYVKYKGELLHISDYKDLMKQKAIAKTKTKVTKVTQKKAKSKTKK